MNTRNTELLKNLGDQSPDGEPSSSRHRDSGNTPLHLVSLRPNKEPTVEWLIGHGAELSCKASSGGSNTALYNARLSFTNLMSMSYYPAFLIRISATRKSTTSHPLQNFMPPKGKVKPNLLPRVLSSKTNKCLKDLRFLGDSNATLDVCDNAMDGRLDTVCRKSFNLDQVRLRRMVPRMILIQGIQAILRAFTSF